MSPTPPGCWWEGASDCSAVGCERYGVQTNFFGPEMCYLQGWVDDFCIFGRQLRETEIRALAGRGPRQS